MLAAHCMTAFLFDTSCCYSNSQGQDSQPTANTRTATGSTNCSESLVKSVVALVAEVGLIEEMIRVSTRSESIQQETDQHHTL
jgi:hypothetical protein